MKESTSNTGSFPGRKVIQRYLNRTATREERYQVERWEQSHPEASKILSALSSGEISLDELPAFKPAFTKWFWLIGALVSVVLLASAAVGIWPNTLDTRYKKSQTIEKLNVAPIEKTSRKLSPSEKFVAPAISVESLEMENESDIESREEGFFSAKVYTDLVELELKPARALEEAAEEFKLKTLTSYPYFFAHNHNIRDYSERQYKLNSEARKAVTSIDDPLHSAVVRQHYQKVPYYQQLEVGMKRLRSGDNAGALLHYRKILKQFPQDENALFYGGLAAFRLGQYSKAQSLLAKAINQKGGVFYEESLWYLALSLQELNNPQADSIFCIIQQYDSFYEDQAVEKIGICD
jgi:tetratricopeptide (TPR) repeat protein